MPDKALNINTNQAISKDAQVLQGEQRSGKSTNKLDSVKVGEDRASLMSSQKAQGSQGRDTRQPKPCYKCTESHNSQKCPFIKALLPLWHTWTHGEHVGKRQLSNK